MERRYRLLLKTVTALVLLAGCLVAGMIYLLNYKLAAMINYAVLNQLQEFGLQSFDSGKPYLGLKGAGTDNISIIGKYKDITYQLDLDGVQAGYSIKPLFSGKLEKLFFNGITADVVVKPDQSKEPTTELELVSWFQLLETLELPIDSTKIGQLKVNIQYLGDHYHVKGEQLVIENDSHQLAGRLEISSTQPFFSDISAFTLGLKPSEDIPWLPELSFQAPSPNKNENKGEKKSENIAGLSATVSWKHPADQALKAIFQSQLHTDNLQNLLTSLDVDSINDFIVASTDVSGDKPLPVITLKAALSGSFAIPEKIELEKTEWLSKTAAQGHAEIQLKLVKPSLKTLIDVGIATDFELQEHTNTWMATGQLNSADLQINTEWQGSFLAGSANSFTNTIHHQFTSDIHLNNLSVLLKRSEELGWPITGLQLASGNAFATVAVNLPVDSTKKPEIKVTAAAENIAGLYQDIAFSGVSWNGSFNRLSTWKSSKALNLKAESISAGIVARNIDVKLLLLKATDFQESQWRLQDFSADLFSGDVSLQKAVDFDYPFTGNTFPIVLSNIRLDKILALYEAQGVAGTGTLEGYVPLTLFKDSFSIDKGHLLNIEPGRINYQNSAAKAVSNPQLAMTLRLLEDFQYQSMNIDMIFEPNGKLLLSTRLSGRNPAEFDGRQVNFNINLEENLYDLFKVLKVTDQLTRELEARLKK